MMNLRHEDTRASTEKGKHGACFDEWNFTQVFGRKKARIKFEVNECLATAIRIEWPQKNLMKETVKQRDRMDRTASAVFEGKTGS